MQAQLTSKEKEIFEFIRSYWLRHQQSPTLNEISEGVQLNSRGRIHQYIASLVDKGLLSKSENFASRNILLTEQQVMTLPLLGTIAAGVPIEAIQGIDTLDIGEMFLGDDKYALRVKGDSMINVGIFSNDWVIIRRQNTANNGNIVVALIDNEEATLKRYYKRDDKLIELVSENDDMPSMKFLPQQIKIQGVLIRSIRNFVSER